MNENEINQAAGDNILQPETENTVKPIRDKRSPAEIAIAVVAVVLVVAMVAAMVVGGLGTAGGESLAPTSGTLEEATHPTDGNHDDVTCKGSYTVEDARAAAEAAKVVATLGDLEMTNADLQIYYWMQVVAFLNEYSYYASALGLDYTQPLDTQMANPQLTGENWTWQQYFLQCALDAWTAYEALALEAVASGFDQQSADYQTYAAAIREEVSASAVEYGYESIDDMLAAIVGPGSHEDAYIDYMQTYYLGYLYYNALLDQLAPTAQEVEDYFDANAAAYEEEGIAKDDSVYVDVRHILIMPQGGTTGEDGKTTYSEAEWEAARVEAQAILDQWLAGDATEEAFAELANTKSYDSDGTDGGLYTYVYEGQMVPAFNDWCFDPAREGGDYGLVKTEYGYHVMYFVDSYSIWYVTAESDMFNEISGDIIPDIVEKYETTVDYTSMVLGLADLA